MTSSSEIGARRHVADKVQSWAPLSITPAELIAAKKLLGWTSVRLASQKGTDYSTLQKFLSGGKLARPFNASHVRAVLEIHGIEFFPDDDGAVVRLRKKYSSLPAAETSTRAF